MGANVYFFHFSLSILGFWLSHGQSGRVKWKGKVEGQSGQPKSTDKVDIFLYKNLKFYINHRLKTVPRPGQKMTTRPRIRSCPQSITGYQMVNFKWAVQPLIKISSKTC